MSFLTEPSPVLLFFLFYKKFVFLQILAVISLLRLIVGRGLVRWPALIAFILSFGGTATVFAPAAGLNQGALYTFAARMIAEAGGMAALLVPALLYAICALSPHARWRILDLVFASLLLVLLGLWWWTS